MRVLIACEESQRVCISFRERGHEAYSCDIKPCSGGHPEWHIQGDALGLLGEGWDLIIAHPPCTYLSVAGACQLYKGGGLNEERYSKGLEAKAFFMKFINAPCEKICVENPRQFKIFEMPAYTQEIQPWMFGHATTKATRLWLKGLPPLKPTNIVKPKTTTKTAGNWYNKAKPGVDRQTQRSKTFWGVARAMAEQWG